VTAPPGGDASGADPGPDPGPGDPASPPVLANASGRQFLRNFVTGYMGLGASLVLSLFLTPIALDHLGASDYGLWIAVTTLGSYFSLLGAGVATATVQRVAESIALHNHERLAEVLATSRAFFTISGIFAFLVTAAIVPFVGDIFHPPSGSHQSAEIALLLIGVFTAAGLFNCVPSAALYGGGRNDRQSLSALAVSLVVQGGQIAVVLGGGGLVGLVAVASIGAVGGFLLTDQVAKRSGLLPLKHARATRAMLRELLKSGGRNVTVQLAGTIAYQLDAVVIGVILPIRQVTPYDLALSTSGLTQSVATAGTGLLIPSYAHSSALDDRERQFRLYSRAVLVSMAISIPVVVALLVFGESLLHLWVGRGGHHVPAHSYQVMVALNIVVVLQLPGTQSFLFLIGIGRNGLVARIALPAALVNLGLSILATYIFGPVGPALGSLPTVIILELTVLPVICCRELGVPVRRYLRAAMAPLAAPLVTAAAVAAILAKVLGRADAARAPFECVIVCGLAWAVLVPVLMKTDPALRRFVANVLRRRAGPQN
jgi:O-antigen/teichoic acid export membrane protein